jgi:four helix bundle protein
MRNCYNLWQEVVDGFYISGFASVAGSDGTDGTGLQEHRCLSKVENYGLAQQMQRAAVSVPSNIAEGKGHHSNKEFVHFLLHARGSLWELQTQILLSEQLTYISKEQGTRLLATAENVSRALNGLITSLSGSV